MINPLVKKLSYKGSLSPEEQDVLTRAAASTRDVAADQEIVTEGSLPSESTLLLSGFTGRYKTVPDGKRQIVAIHITGDFVDLHSFLLKRMDHSVFTMTPCTIALVPHERLHDITERFPHLTRLLWLNTLVDAAIHREWLVGMGRRSAVANVAHLICELYLRLWVVGQTEHQRFGLPITQEELADALGLSVVHLNRSLQDLRSRGLITWRGSDVAILDWERLSAFANFDPTYLNLEHLPR